MKADPSVVGVDVNALSNSTRVEITVSRPRITIPLFQTLRSNLTSHFTLRDILSNPDRTVTLEYVDTNGRTKNQIELQYRQPKGELVRTAQVVLPSSQATCDFNIYRAAEPLMTPAEIGPFAEAGILVKGTNATYDNILTKYEHDVNARR